MNPITQKLLEMVTGVKGAFDGRFQHPGGRGLRGQPIPPETCPSPPRRTPPAWWCGCGRNPGGAGVYPRLRHPCGVDDLVYNDFLIGENAQVTIVAGAASIPTGRRRPATTASTAFSWKKGPRYAMRKSTLGTAGVRASAASIR